MKYGRLYRLDSSFDCAQFLHQALLKAEVQLSNDECEMFHEKWKAQNAEDELSALSNGAPKCTVSLWYLDNRRYFISLHLYVFAISVCQWTTNTFDCAIRASVFLQILFECIQKQCYLNKFDEKDDEIELELQFNDRLDPDFRHD